MIDYSNAFVFSTSLLVVVFRYGFYFIFNRFSRTKPTLTWFCRLLNLLIEICFNFFLEAVDFIKYHKL